MMDWIAGAYQGVKTARDMAKGLADLNTDVAVKTRAHELLDVILDVYDKLFEAQTQRTALTSRIAELEEENRRHKDWVAEKSRYALHQIEGGGYVYRLKPAHQSTEPSHDLCPSCYEDSIKSILQYKGYVSGHKAYTCKRCSTEVLGELPDSSRPSIVTWSDLDNERGY